MTNEQFTREEVRHAILQFLTYAEKQQGISHQGYFSGNGWAARALRSCLDLPEGEIDMQGIGVLRGDEVAPLDERAQFEAWVRREEAYPANRMKFGQFGPNTFDDWMVQDGWEAWQARSKINNDPEKIGRLQRDCGEAYQVIGAGMLGTNCVFTQSDVARALDNLSAAANGELRPHDDLLPWPKGAA